MYAKYSIMLKVHYSNWKLWIAFLKYCTWISGLTFSTRAPFLYLSIFSTTAIFYKAGSIYTFNTWIRMPYCSHWKIPLKWITFCVRVLVMSGPNPLNTKAHLIVHNRGFHGLWWAQLWVTWRQVFCFKMKCWSSSTM